VALRLLVADSPAERRAAEHVEAQVFLETFGNTPEVMEEEYGPYRDVSRFVTVIDDADGAALGAVRLIVPGGPGLLKTLADVGRAPWHLSTPAVLGAAGLTDRPVWDVASLAVDRRFRRGAAGAEVTLALCHGLYEYSRRSGVEGWVTVLDDRVLELLRVMGVPWDVMAGGTSTSYLGSDASTPCVCEVGAIVPHMRIVRPDLIAPLVDGVLGSIAVDPDNLSPERGVHRPLPPVERNRQPLPPRRDTTGWRPPTARRTAPAETV
jgi:N-acyl-L-homoserine lactone synthetase